MAKAKPGQSGFKEATATAVVDEIPREIPENETEPLDITAETVIIEIPLGNPKPHSSERLLHVDAQLSRKQSNNLRRMLVGLRDAKETCTTATGSTRLVDTNQDVLRWLLDSAALEDR